MKHVDHLCCRRRPVPQIHAPVSRERRVELGKIIPSHNNRHSRVLVFEIAAPHRSFAHHGWIVANIHQRTVRDLRIHRPEVVFKFADAGVQVVNNQTTQFPRLSRIPRRAQIPPTQQRPWFTRDSILELTRGCHDGRQTHGFTRELHVERLPAPFPTPNPQYQRRRHRYPTRIIQYIFRYVHRHALHEPLGHIKPVTDV